MMKNKQNLVQRQKTATSNSTSKCIVIFHNLRHGCQMIQTQSENKAHVLLRIPRLGVAKLHPGLHIAAVYTIG